MMSPVAVCEGDLLVVPVREDVRVPVVVRVLERVGVLEGVCEGDTDGVRVPDPD